MPDKRDQEWTQRACARGLNSAATQALRLICNVLYYAFARHLMSSEQPGGTLARWIRYQVCRHMFDACGLDVNVEHGALINSGSKITVGDNSTIGLDAYISGPLVVGRNVLIGPRCTFLSINRAVDSPRAPMITQGFRPARPPVLEDDVMIGSNVTVLPGRRVGTGSVVCPGSIVASDVPPFAIVLGAPARVVGSRRPVTP